MFARKCICGIGMLGLVAIVLSCSDSESHLNYDNQLRKFRANEPILRDVAERIGNGAIKPDADGRYAIPEELRKAGVFFIRHLQKRKIVLFEAPSHPIDSNRAFGFCYDSAQPDPIQAIREEWGKRVSMADSLGDRWFVVFFD